MSSTETNTPSRSADDRDLEQRLTEGAKIGLPIAAVAGATIAAVVQGPSAAILVLAGSALVAVIALFWASVRTLVGETPLSGADAYALGAPRAEEEQKRAVLRALKDLEFERSVGKINEDDYAAQVTRLRAEAKRLLRVLDEESAPQREQVEELVQARLWREGLADPPGGYRDAPPEKAGPTKKPKPARKAQDTGARSPSREKIGVGKGEKAAPKAAPDPVVEPAKAEEPNAGAEPREESGRRCDVCSARNDADALFCKKCGMNLGASESETNADEKDEVVAETKEGRA